MKKQALISATRPGSITSTSADKKVLSGSGDEAEIIAAKISAWPHQPQIYGKIRFFLRIGPARLKKLTIYYALGRLRGQRSPLFSVRCSNSPRLT